MYIHMIYIISWYVCCGVSAPICFWIENFSLFLEPWKERSGRNVRSRLPAVLQGGRGGRGKNLNWRYISLNMKNWKYISLKYHISQSFHFMRGQERPLCRLEWLLFVEVCHDSWQTNTAIYGSPEFIKHTSSQTNMPGTPIFGTTMMSKCIEKISSWNCSEFRVLIAGVL